MAGGLKAIKKRLVSAKNTRQITKAMKLVSAAKLNRAQEAATNAQIYSSALVAIVNKLLLELDTVEDLHPLMHLNKSERTLLVVVGGSVGLCGPYNANINKEVSNVMKEFGSVDIISLGKKPTDFLKRKRISPARAYTDLGEDPNAWPLEEIAEFIEEGYLTEDYGKVLLVYTKFKSVISQKVERITLLPFKIDDGQEGAVGEKGIASKSSTGVYKFEPSAKELFSSLVPRLMRVVIREACFSAKASEHASRMTAMDSATKNAGELIDKLQLLHNRVRQANITGELLDIVGGVEALKD